MNRQKETVITVTYNELGIIVDTKAEPRKKGKWTDKHHYSDEESGIEEWQSCRCSECGRYDTRPYMYYFSEPNYCSYCGARMTGVGCETFIGIQQGDSDERM